jgi:formamidopyrimidine-DNA glycosylase
MPEVIEVCVTAMWLDYAISGSTIKRIRVGKGSRYYRDNKLPHSKKFPMTITSVKSKAKLMYIKMRSLIDSNEYYLLNTFGMSGRWTFDYANANCGIEFHLTSTKKGDTILYFCDNRHYGTICITPDIKYFKQKLALIADDFLQTPPTFSKFYETIIKYVSKTKARRDNTIVEILIEQKKASGIGSGIGNYLVSEILYHAKISPHTPIVSFCGNKKLAKRLYTSIKYILKYCYMTMTASNANYFDPGINAFLKRIRKIIKANPNSKYNFIPDVIIPDRKLLRERESEINDYMKFNVYYQDTDPLGNPVVKEKIITKGNGKGRTTHWVPSVQKLY